MDNKPFNKYYVLRITSLHIKKSIDTSIRKTYDRLKDVETDEVFKPAYLDTKRIENTVRMLAEKGVSINLP
mgnify:CR=1 FL=1